MKNLINAVLIFNFPGDIRQSAIAKDRVFFGDEIARDALRICDAALMIFEQGGVYVLKSRDSETGRTLCTGAMVYNFAAVAKFVGPRPMFFASQLRGKAGR